MTASPASPARPSPATLFVVVIVLRLLSLSPCCRALSSSPSTTTTTTTTRPGPDWSSAGRSLRDPSVCVVWPAGLDDRLSVLRDVLCGDDAHRDLDLRMRVRCSSDDDDDDGPGGTTTLVDCERIIDAVLASGGGGGLEGRTKRQASTTDDGSRPALASAAASALAELALGVSSLADASFDFDPDVHVRVAIASDYRAIDPPFHTDKCPLRAYATLFGPGTEFVTSTCRPWEYAALRAMGDGAPRGTPRARMARELEFIVMKGDRYVHPRGGSSSSSSSSSLWSRSSACVHRSPPGSSSSSSGGGGGGRRVILSLDLANGEDDREWYDVGRKREWRSGMTQRKSRLVS